MKPPNWDRIQEIYAAALALPSSERSSHIANACAGDSDLARDIVELLEARDSAGDVLNSPIIRLNPMSDTLAGTTIAERYVVEKELGHTIMSQVYLARDLRLKRQPVVIKILSEALFDADAKERFDRELKTLLHLDHQNVVKVQDSGELPDGRSYLVMPYIDGETLRSRIPNEGMDLERVALIVKQIGAALDHVHENGIFHRDLKPENIMLKRGTDSVVLIDFGIAKVRTSILEPTANTTSGGTLLYMSPEQLTGQRITAASDIYSMGVVAYETVTGRRPFNPSSHVHLVDLQRAGVRVRPMQLRENLSTKADRTIIRALSFEPKARYQTAGEFADRFAQALLEEGNAPLKVPLWVKLTGALIMLALLAFVVAKYREGTSGPTTRFKYWFTVQRMHDGKEYSDPIQSNGEETFATGDKFRLNVSSLTPAHLYIFAEGPSDADDPSFVMIYPRTATNGASSTVGSNQPIQSDWITFRGPPGSEDLWIVWSVRPVSELESVRVEALKHPRGGLTGETLVAVKEFLRTKQAEFKTTVYHFQAGQTADGRGKTDVLITLAQFKHR